MRNLRTLRTVALGMTCGLVCATANSAPMTYDIDTNHTYPSFEADHGGMSLWRGKFSGATGTVVLDKDANSGSVDIDIDMSTIDFGHQGLNDHSKTADMFDVEQFPTATYTGNLAGFSGGSPTSIDGTLTMHGVSQPLQLAINTFACRVDPRQNREVCGADASATLDRSDWGVDFGSAFGFKMDVTLRIQIEALVQE